MFLVRRPSDDRIRHFVDCQSPLSVSYVEAGASRDGAPAGYPINHHRSRIGTGSQDFRRAAEALRQWKMYDQPWTRLCWPDRPIVVGETFAVLAYHFGLWSLNAVRIIYVLDDDGTVPRYGFAIGTLPGHAEQGEERFTVEWHREDDSVWYELFAFARPKHPLARAGYPLAWLVQKRFARASARTIAAAVRGERV